ncbi:F-box protein AUF1 [Linum perenne]
MDVDDDCFDLLPDPIVLIIFNRISDVKTLILCRSVSKRFNSLVPQAEWLCLRVDRVISSTSSDDDDNADDAPFFNFFNSIVDSIQNLFNLGGQDDGDGFQSFCSPAMILSGFDRIRRLEIELPGGDLELEKGVVVNWRAEFGKTMRNCVIMGFRSGGSPATILASGADMTQGLKTAVVWTVTALMAATARHELAGDVVRGEENQMERLVLKDAEGEGTLVMEKEGLAEFGRGGGRRRRTVEVPAVKMRMRYEGEMEMKSGVWVKSAMLVVVRPWSTEVDDDVEEEDAELAMAAFGCGAYKDVVGALLKRRSFSLEMNSF